MTVLTYSQLEGLWIKNGGEPSKAPLMAAIALAESGGQTNALNPSDNGGRQSSYGLWQISTGTHTAPSPQWADPNVNARLAVGKLKSQGLTAWGTYTSGAYKRYYANGVPPSTSISGGALSAAGSATTAEPVSLVDDSCAWHVHLPVAGDTCIAHKSQVRAGLSILVIGMGVAIGLGGVILLVAYGLKRNILGSKDVTRLVRNVT